MNTLSENGLRIVPTKHHESNKLEWVKYNGIYQDCLFVTVKTDLGEFRSEVGRIMEIRNGQKEDGEISYRYDGICDRLGISNDVSSNYSDIIEAKKWVEKNYGIRECQ